MPNLDMSTTPTKQKTRRQRKPNAPKSQLDDDMDSFKVSSGAAVLH